MAKGIRSKVMRRLRTVRRNHYWEIEGKQKLQDISAKLQDPTYDFKQDGSLKANAFLEPSNPNAIFPQHAKPHILDFRAHKMAGSGFTSIGNFRKMMSATAKKSKYDSVVRTPSDIERDDLQAEMEEQMQMEARAKAADDSDEVDADQLKKKKAYNVDDITKDLEKQMKISKKKGTQQNDNFEMDLGTKTIKKGEKISALRKKRKAVRSRS
jgi:hypothetical protein